MKAAAAVATRKLLQLLQVEKEADSCCCSHSSSAVTHHCFPFLEKNRSHYCCVTCVCDWCVCVRSLVHWKHMIMIEVDRW